MLLMDLLAAASDSRRDGALWPGRSEEAEPTREGVDRCAHGRTPLLPTSSDFLYPLLVLLLAPGIPSGEKTPVPGKTL
jgi:hypothetical protein